MTSRPAAAQRLSDLAGLRRVRDRIDREYAQPLDVEALARASLGTFSSRFAELVGVPPSVYRRQAARAMSFLRTADEPTERADMIAERKLDPSIVNVRVKISALWTSMLFIWVYVDLFSLYRPDFRAEVEAGEIAGFTVNESFLLGTTVYVVIPCLMVSGTLILGPRVNRVVNIALPILYTITIILGAIGEWNYYILGSAIEIALLAAIGYYAWIWSREAPPTSTGG